MASLVCIGRLSTVERWRLHLQSLGHSLHTVGSLHEYLSDTRDLGADVVLVSETFEFGTRQSVAHWVKHATPAAKVVFLYEHYIGDATAADGIANVGDLQNVTDAIDFVLSERRAAAVAGR